MMHQANILKTGPGPTAGPDRPQTERLPRVHLRDYPHPFQAAMAICSDLDETPDARTYLEIARFLNTTAATTMGPGVGLEVGNSIYFDMPADQFAYWTTDDAGRAMVRRLIASGHVDVLHSYGDLATTRGHAERALAELERHGCRLEVWVDHSKSPSNFGPDIMVGRGDLAGGEAYHADLTLRYGVRYVWRGRTTGITGQNAPIDLGAYWGLVSLRHPTASVRTLAKEAAKIRLGARGHPRWEMYADNVACRPGRLRDGQAIWEFLRSNPYWAGSGKGDTPEGINEVLSLRMLRRLVRRRGVCVLYTHLGKVRNPAVPFGPGAQAALRRLAEFGRSGEILVTTTRRLLRFLTVRDGLCYRLGRAGEVLQIVVEGVDDAVSGWRAAEAEELAGLVFEIDADAPAEVVLAGGAAVPAECVRVGGRVQVRVPWRPLEFPEIRLDGLGR